jgi:adenosylcobinamide-phosphate synthase
VALALDALLGEPPPAVHPVVVMGRVLQWLEQHAPDSDASRFVYGLAAAAGAPLAWGVLAQLVESRAHWLVQGMLLKPTFAGRSLLQAGRHVEDALRAGDLQTARAGLHALVSRPTDELDPPLVAAAAVESLAENVVDSWLSPLLAYAAFGLPGAYAYRAANTADAMWGYRTRQYEWLGKGAARLDDLLNWLPSRLAAVLLLLLGPRPFEALRTVRRDGHATASPNAGMTMAVVAGHLNVRLEKRGQYVLNTDGRLPEWMDLVLTRAMVLRVMLLGAGLVLLLRR